MKATERKWPQYILVLLIGVVLGIVVSYQTGWFSPHDGTTPVKKRVSFIAEAKGSASADVKSLAASLSGVAQRVMPPWSIYHRCGSIAPQVSDLLHRSSGIPFSGISLAKISSGFSGSLENGWKEASVQG